MSARIENVVGKDFDYVIIGGGTAGLTLAAKLSEDPASSVLVLEAGEANINDPNILLPASYGSHFSQDLYAWPYKRSRRNTQVELKCFGDVGKVWGALLASISCVIQNLPTEDINDIERLGNPGWNWEHYNRLLQKVEGFVPPTDEALEKAQLKVGLWNIGTEGPLKISFPATISGIVAKMQETMSNVGLPPAPDPLGGNPSGYYIAPNMYDHMDHTRSYSTTALYLPNKGRPNLTVLVSARVGRIITDPSVRGNVVAKGVEFTYGGEGYTVGATKEMVLCAGAIKSPQILELSGIGNTEILDRIKVPVKVELLGVGYNVQEHLYTGLSFELKDDVSFDPVDLLHDPEIAAKQLELHKTGSGIYTQGIVSFAYAPLEAFSPRAAEIINAAKEKYRKKMESCAPGLKDQYKIHLARLERAAPNCECILYPGLLSSRSPPVPGRKYITLVAGLNHAWSRGTIHSVSDDPSQEPEMDPHDFEEDVDLQMFVETMNFARRLFKTAPLKDLVVKELDPGPEVTTNAQMEEYLKKYYESTFHTVGSCSMLPKEKGGVVDPNLKVYGTDNIRVADLSILPIHTAAHTQSIAYAIAEDAVEAIKGIKV